ncbi:MAG: FAD-containing monooxygenase EthA [SAR86 cluster bacterium]|uniref:FAD-containing monooxygenase EthA n=1 Tax=SAR86 cluster bacterium TaxID=2030880 RepID=A0A2A5B943_9GAMM|nr:MAG: FAD-containing monooxygenase EthA [SAR86 cluster bacterium]
MNHFDVVIVGAGLSGIGAAYHLQDKCPGKTFAILEGREAIGGTWDLFRYPGIRSDSDMHTLGYNFKPWIDAKAIADGPSIRKYVNETADENNIRQHIRFNRRVTSASWSTKTALWTVQVELVDSSETMEYSCNFLFMCGGYYNYDEGYTPEFKSADAFKGVVIHPQFWPEDFEYKGKRVIVIGSGATAMTLVPAMAEGGAQVTMLQRSPTYVVSRPAQDKIANVLRKFLPESWAYAITRFKNIQLGNIFLRRALAKPEKTKDMLLKMVRKAMPDIDVDTHFTPSYNPWDQRLCLIPDDDLYNVINKGLAKVVTNHIDCFTEKGIRLVSGEELEADIIVTATGLKLSVANGLKLYVDGETVNIPETVSYKGMMYSGVPNLVQTFGYINASWTLRADMIAQYSCQLLNHMDSLGLRQCTPIIGERDKDMELRPWISDFTSGYMQRMMHLLPKQGEGPWENIQNYARDKKQQFEAPLDDGAMQFTNPVKETKAA